MQLNRSTQYLLLSIFVFSCNGKEDLAHFTVKSDGVASPTELNIDDIYFPGMEHETELLYKKGSEMVAVPFQIDTQQTKRLWFMTNENGDTEYILRTKENTIQTENVLSSKDQGDLSMAIGEREVLTYRYGMTYPPLGVDSVFKKSGYVHPILTPKGDTLSRIQPPDHFHHYGMWGPWTHTQIKGQQVDFWNLGDRKGTVLFKEFNSTQSGPVYGSFNAAQEHIDFLTQDTPQLALNENLEVTVWDLNREDRYMFDYKTKFSTPLEDGILFEAYRYGGGIGMRFTERWKADNCTVLTSEGKDRLTADGTNARWCIVKGTASSGKGTNGILFMSHTENRMHPEPMRIWPIDGNNGRGDMFFEFCPIRHNEWNIEPNKNYQLKYRMVVFEGDLSKEEADSYWQSFVTEPQIKLLNK